MRHYLPAQTHPGGACRGPPKGLSRDEALHQHQPRRLRKLPRLHPRHRLPGPDLRRDRFRPQGADRSFLVRERHRLHEARRLPLLRGNHRRPLAKAGVAPARSRQARVARCPFGAASIIPGASISPASAAWASASPPPRWSAPAIARATTSSSATRTASPSATAASTRTSPFSSPAAITARPSFPTARPISCSASTSSRRRAGSIPRATCASGGPRTRAIVNRQKTPTIHTLLGTDDFCVETLETASLRKYTDAAGYFQLRRLAPFRADVRHQALRQRHHARHRLPARRTAALARQPRIRHPGNDGQRGAGKLARVQARPQARARGRRSSPAHDDGGGLLPRGRGGEIGPAKTLRVATAKSWRRATGSSSPVRWKN